MNFHIITDNFLYLMLGSWPDGPLGGAALTLALSAVCGVPSALLGLIIGIVQSYLKGIPLAVINGYR